MNWDLNEFRNLCAKHNVSDTTDYVNTVRFKKWQIEYFSQMSLDVWEELFSAGEVVGLSSDFHDTWNKAEAYAEAALQALHSLGDVIAQIVNLVVLSGSVPEGYVTLKIVYDDVRGRPDASDVAMAMEKMLYSDSFRYTTDFTNTVKHRKLLDTEFYSDINPKTGFDKGLRFKAFTFHRGKCKRSWPAKTVKEIREVVVPDVYQGIMDIGNALNSYLS